MNVGKLILYGIYIGVGKIIPGVSGSLIAMTLGVYEKGIDSIDNFFKDIKNNCIFLGSLGIGIIISIMFGSKIIDYLLHHYYFYTIFLFLGLLFGTINDLKNKVVFNLKNIFIIFFISIIMFLISFNSNHLLYYFNNTVIDYLYTIFLGFIDAISMVIPGISGTAIYILLGTYNFVLDIFASPLSNKYLFIFFLVGLIIGVILTTKLMNYLLKNKKNIIYPIIFGFSISSLIAILIRTILLLKINILIIIYLIIFFTGYYIGIKISD